jgi:5-methylcytosine-specific restriction endonuclease McrA
MDSASGSPRTSRGLRSCKTHTLRGDQMPPRKTNIDVDQITAEARRYRESREKTYRERALKLFPHVCGRCGREFSGKKLRELTVHHKDHNHDNNPPDGSNWELLCIYCHDHEHSKYLDDEYSDVTPGEDRSASSTFRPFAGLQDLLKKKQQPADSSDNEDA